MAVKKTKANHADRYGKRVLGKGISVSNNTRDTGLNNNDLVIGSAGSSKTGSIVFTQLKTLQDSSLIVVDTKGQLHKMFKDELAKKGYKVRVLDFVNPMISCRYNPLDYVRCIGGNTYNELDIMKISAALIPDNLARDEVFWPISARAILDFLISYTLTALPREDHNMYTVARLYRIFTGRNRDMAFGKWVFNNPNSFAAKRYEQIEGMMAAEKTMGSIYGFVNIALYPFDLELLRDIFDPNKYGPDDNLLDISSIGKEKTVIFLNISDTDHSIDNLVNLFYTQTLQVLTSEADKLENGQLTVPCRIILDDFASGTRIPDFDKLISVVRSRDIWLTLCIQSLSQLESLYSKPQALTIINNCDHIIFLGTNDMDSAEFIGTRAGKAPETILSMDRTKEYYIEGGKNAVLRDKTPSYSYDEASM